MSTVNLHKNAAEKLWNIHLDRKNARQGRQRAAQLYHIPGGLSIGKIDKKSVGILYKFPLDFYDLGALKTTLNFLPW